MAKGRGGCGCFSLLVVIAMIVGGGQQLFVAVTNWSPTEMTCAAYAQQRPSGKWVDLHDCELHVEEASYSSLFGVGDPSELFIPAFPVGAGDDAKALVVLRTSDRGLLDLSTELAHLDKADETAQLTWLASHLSDLHPVRDVAGTVQFGIDLTAKEHDQVKALGDSLDPGFVIVKDGDEPHLAGALVMLALGVGCGALWIGINARKTATPGA